MLGLVRDTATDKKHPDVGSPSGGRWFDLRKRCSPGLAGNGVGACIPATHRIRFPRLMAGEFDLIPNEPGAVRFAVFLNPIGVDESRQIILGMRHDRST